MNGGNYTVLCGLWPLRACRCMYQWLSMPKYDSEPDCALSLNWVHPRDARGVVATDRFILPLTSPLTRPALGFFPCCYPTTPFSSAVEVVPSLEALGLTRPWSNRADQRSSMLICLSDWQDTVLFSGQDADSTKHKTVSVSYLVMLSRQQIWSSKDHRWEGNIPWKRRPRLNY